MKMSKMGNMSNMISISNTSLVAPGALAHRLQRRTACNAAPPTTPHRLQRRTACNTAEANLHSQVKKRRSLLYSNLGAPINFR